MTTSLKTDRTWVPSRMCYCANTECRFRPEIEACPSKERNKKGVQLFNSVNRNEHKKISTPRKYAA